MFMLVFFCAVTLRMLPVTQAEAKYFIIAPNVIRVDVEETILVNVIGTSDGDVVPVTLYFQLAGSNQRISETTVRVQNDNPQEKTLKICRDQLPQQDTSEQQFITLIATADTQQLQFNDRRTILLSYQSGFVFIQTDKPLYTPLQPVDIRVVALDQKMHPVNHQVKVDIINPDQIIVHRYEEVPQSAFLTLQFAFPPLPVFGNWTVRAYYGHKFKANTSVQFEVKEYVLPKFNVEVTVQAKYIVAETERLITHITARYAFGEPVVGNCLVKYGVYTDDGNLTILQIKQGQLNDDGKDFQTLDMADVEVENWAETLVGKRLVIQAFVTDTSSGETINANNTQVTFSRTPYKFNWELTQRYFKKGMPFTVKTNVQLLSGLPAAGVDVAIRAIARKVNQDEVALQGSLAQNVQDDLLERSGPQGEVDFRLDVPSDADLVTITLTTRDSGLSDSAQSQGTFIVQPQESSSNEFLLVHRPILGSNRKLQIGRASAIEVQLTHPENVGTLHFFVIAGGRIVHRGVRRDINPNMGLDITVTQDMEPSARVVAYCASTTGNIIADSLIFEVKEKCENPIHLEFKGLDRKHNDERVFQTDGFDKNVELKISAFEYTNIGLLAVDEAIFTLRNYHRLTQKKVFERMAGYDLGCGPGGGPTTATVFKDAGVTLLTNAGVDVPQREALGCPTEAKRSRRSISQADRDNILNKYHSHLRRYCQKGLRQLRDPDSMTCAERARHFARRNRLDMESREIQVFFNCCEAMKEADRGRNSGSGSSGSDSVNLEDVLVRSNFPESWMFDEVNTEDEVMIRHLATLPDSVTTWVIEAIGVSEDYKLCVADPVKLEVRPPFFLDLTMPYTVQRLEQIEILVSVFNYESVQLPVYVYLKGVEGLCSAALQPGGYSPRVSIIAEPMKSTSVKFVIVPLLARTLPIEVVAVTNSTTVNYQDAVRRLLNVRPEGYKQRDTVTITVDPENTRGSQRSTLAGGQNQYYQHTQFWPAETESKQVDIIRYELNNEAIPGTHEVHFSLMGNMMGSIIETVLRGLDDILRIPRGCGEQTMIYLAPNIYVYRYLKYTNQFTASHETSSRQYIGDGIGNELAHRRSDGSFSVWGDNPSYPSSTWLTAFVSKVMCQAKEFAFVDDAITCQAMEWLITETQLKDGSFRELYRVHHQEMTGGVQGRASLTAYVLIALLECNCKTIDKNESVANATAFLERELPALTRPYALAITSYALALAKSSKAENATDQLKATAISDGANSRYWGSDDSSFGAGPKPYWYSNRPKAIEVETTSYALLAFLKVGQVQYSHAIVNWLTNQENYEGGFVSTQDTVIALQALSEYAIQTDQNAVDINCHVTCTQSNFEERYLLKPHNAIIRQHSTIPVQETTSQLIVSFDSQGAGLGQVKFESNYHIPEPDHSKCDFDLSINGKEGKSGDSGSVDSNWSNIPDDGDSRSRVGRIQRSAMERGSGHGDSDSAISDTNIGDTMRGRAAGLGSEYHFEYNIKVRYLRGEETGMAIVDVGLYTGFKPKTEELNDVKEQSGGVIQRYEVTDRSVVFYLTKITEEYTVINFNAQRVHHVGKAQPVAVRVYDYYNPTVECVKFIHPQSGSDMLSTLCEGETCICAAGECAENPFAKYGDFMLSKLKAKACASSAHFAYEVQVTGFKRKAGFQYITMTIVTPIKLGLDSVIEGDTRTFWKSMNCGKPEIKKKRYLVIGSGGLPITDDEGLPSFKYVVDEKMSFYEWPSASKARSVKKWKKIADNIKTFKDDFAEGGSGCTA